MRLNSCKTGIYIISLLLAATLSYAQKGEIILKNSFDKRKELREWEGSAFRLIGPKGSKELRLKSRTDQKNALLRYELPNETVRGTKLAIKALVKTEDVSKPINSWNGVKLMVHAQGAFGDFYPQASIPYGTADWKEASFLVSVPDNTDLVELVLGLEESSGTVYFDNLEVKIIEQRRTIPAQPNAHKYKGHNKDRLRGTMVATDISEEDLRVLGSWGANHIRFQMTWNGFPASEADTATLETYMSWLRSKLDHLDKLLPICRELGINVAIDMHTLPGGRERTHWEARVFKEPKWRDAFVDAWKYVAGRYRGNPVIWGYDLANEPQEGGAAGNMITWRELAEITAKAIRTIDTTHAIIVESANGGSPVTLTQMQPLDVPGVVYSFHMYEPAYFTHQNISDTMAGVPYPGTVGKTYWDKEQMEKFLQPIADWQKDYNVHIYIGEFSAIRWAPDSSAYNYLRDCIELFERYEWDWSYHAFREWEGWSVEYDNNKNHKEPSSETTPRQQLLMDWFSKNE